MPRNRPRPVVHPAAVPTALPAALKPQLATLVRVAPAGDDWEYEIKYDGYRIMARLGEDLRLFTKNGHDWTGRLPHVRAALIKKGLPQGWYDGEIVVHDEQGRPSFSKLQGAITPRHEHSIVYYLFDCPYAYGYDLRAVPLSARRELLQALLLADQLGAVRFSESLSGAPDEIIALVCSMGLEGVMAKRMDSAYTSRRSSSWVKLKCGFREKFRVCGFTGLHAGPVRSLILGRASPDGSLTYCGKVQGGLTDLQRREIGVALRLILVDECPIKDPPTKTKIRWVKPLIGVEVAYAEMTDRGTLRHPVFKAIAGVV